MPGNGFAFAVRVGGQINVLGVLRRFFQFIDGFLFRFDDAVRRLEIFFQINTQFAFRQILNMTHRSDGIKIVSEKFFYRFNFCGRLHNHQRICHNPILS